MDTVKKILDRLFGFATNEEFWVNLGVGALKITAILLLCFIILKILKIAVHNIFKMRQKAPIRISERREATLARLLDNVITYVLCFIALIMILDTFGVEVKAILAGAGIVGLAVGFGAQSLVKDVITGFFIIFEDQFAVGDYVRIGNFEGYVESIGLRVTKIKSWTGEVHILPNGSITQVTNYSLNNSVAVVDVSIAYEEDIEKAEEAICELLPQLPEKYEDMVAPPELLGVQNLASSEVVLRIVCETKPMRHVSVARAIRKEVKMHLDKKGIEIPFPRLVMYNRQGQENGAASQTKKENA
ncbi:mechanosensitive ion channel family protein [Parageobacillus thermoglucosidasius]|uniref:Mechanosensitive ion channel protein MscS n=2 Tax=Parageobacillus thermoglucosidasius TaxID=1426 RepID=A0AAN1D5S8_PARTM|nr:mechanosensitive ion channel family protein [Parageobacillus thermoglucosidasius]REK56976.1 MAG: mechanosensitive ion channel family protein [Geobacillus sp.]ALF09095.1 mechanosensitive ion channel protein MscS [Parageobacillus thermoglucosidasius]ANZ29176.1 mechanosensitive ion channel protein MscS [Parageobacillus thermoglucosidasius]APM79915.1 mechanosensitive ion channel protein MscS [Parageobacillus thermoglucosidasius]KJX70073.1 mechanosensitive ion channel protein MscS [Parageobacill